MMVATWRTSIQCAAPRIARDVTSVLTEVTVWSSKAVHCSSHYVSLERIKKTPCAAGSSYFISLFPMNLIYGYHLRPLSPRLPP